MAAVLKRIIYSVPKNLNKTLHGNENHLSFASFSSMKTNLLFPDLDNVSYEKICSETLESLTDYFEEIIESDTQLSAGDVSYGDGVLTVNLGKKYGTYVINRQSPNKQIWLSSPTSGPKRYDFAIPKIDANKKNFEIGFWVYKHTGEKMHQLLQNEISKIIKDNVDFFKLPYSGGS